MSRGFSTDEILRIQQGKVPGKAIMSALGEWEAGQVDAAGEDCCRWRDFTPDGPSILPTPSGSGDLISVASEGAQDTSAGTGIRTLRIHYLDTAGLEQIHDVTMTGGTPVDTGISAIFINDVHALTVGSGGVAAGNIGIYKTGGSIASDLYQMIGVGGNKSLVPHRMVPSGKKLYLQCWTSEEAQGKRSAIRIRSTDHNGILFPGVFCFKGTSYLKQTAAPEKDLFSVEVPALSIVKVSHWDDQAGTEGSCSWFGVLIDDPV